jgi:GDP/UDP-N,N'-diacetylbacillosamine 2-epimerase (hydrolysing)
MKKICVVTGTRAEYGLLYWLLKGIEEDPELALQLLVTGMHLSPEWGYTYKEIERDGFSIHKKIEILLASDSVVGISKAVGLGLIGFAEAFAELQPDIVLLLGDRFEVLAAATAACMSNLPIAHLNGGETTLGTQDEAIRHAVTKMAHLHFTSNEVYRRRIIQLGEQPHRVFSVGAMSIENIKRLPLLSKEAFEESIQFKLAARNLLVTFHPATLEGGAALAQFRSVLEVLDEQTDTGLIFTLPNADAGSHALVELLREWVAERPQKACLFASLGMIRYLSAMQFVDAVVGNSSSGIVEAPSFGIGTINIGDRQEGRIKAGSVIDCAPDAESIRQAFAILYSPSFQEGLKEVENPFGSGTTSAAILKVLKAVDPHSLLKKPFYDLDVPAQR